MGYVRCESIVDKILEATCCHRVQRSLDLSSILDLDSRGRADVCESPTDPGSDRWSRLFQSLLTLANYPDSLQSHNPGHVAASGEKKWSSVAADSSDEDGSQDSDISRKVLRVVEIFSEAVARQVADAADVTLQCCVWGPVVGLFRNRQSSVVWQELLHLFPKLITRHAADLLGRNADGHILRELFSWLMCMAAFDDRDVVRRRANSIIRLLLKASFHEHDGLMQVKVVSTLALMDILEFRVKFQATDPSKTGCHPSEQVHPYRRSKSGSVYISHSRGTDHVNQSDAATTIEHKVFSRSETFAIGSYRDSSHDAADCSPRAKVDSPSRNFSERSNRKDRDGRRPGELLKGSWSEDLEILKRPGSPSFAAGAHARLKTSGVFAWTPELLEKLLKSLCDLETAESEQICKESRCQSQHLEARNGDVKDCQVLWKEAIRDLGLCLRHVLHAWCAHHSLMGRAAVDRVLVSENCLAISKTCLHVPDLSIHWLVRLSQSYTEGYSEVFLPEAAQCLVACASITIQHLLRWTNCPVWGAEHLRTLQKICPDMPVIFPNLLKAGREKISPSKSFVATHFQLGIGALSVKSDMDADCHESCRHHQTIFGDRSVELGGAVFPTDTHLLEEKVRNKLANALIQISKERHSEDGSEDGSFGLKKRASSEYFRSSWKAKPSRSVHDIGKDISRVIGFSEVTVERVLQHLHAASELFRRAGFTEAAAELIEVAIPVYKCRHDYKEVIKCHSVLASICNSMCLQAEMWEEPTIDAVYFRVGFLGDRFGSRLAGKQFVYREDRHTHLSDLMERIGKFYEKNLGGQQFLRIISDPNQIEPSSLLPGIGYLQITPVEPLFEKEKNNPGSKTLLRKFYFSTRLAGSTSELASRQYVCSCGFKGSLQKRRKTTLATRAFFPNLVGRLEVVQSRQTLVSLFEHIVDLLESWTRKLRCYLETAAIQLHRILQGILSAVYTHHILTVLPICYKPPGMTARLSVAGDRRKSMADVTGNGDVLAIHPVDEPSSWKPCPSCCSVLEALQPNRADKERLVKAVTQFLATVRKALKVNSEYTDRRDRRLQASVSGKFQQLIKELSVYVRGSDRDLTTISDTNTPFM